MKKIIKTISIYTLIIFLFTSCEGIVGDDGYIFSTETKKPIENAMVILFLNDKPSDTSYTDKNGFFKATDFVGCVPNCPTAKILISKKNYFSKKIDINKYWKKNKPQINMNLYLVPKK